MPAEARVTDPLSCGDHIAAGSPNVFDNFLPVARKGDPTTGHGCFPPSKIKEGASTVFVNNIPVAYVSHAEIPHCCNGCHSGKISKGSPNAFDES